MSLSETLNRGRSTMLITTRDFVIIEYIRKYKMVAVG